MNQPHQSVRDLVGVMAAPGLVNPAVRPELVTDEECSQEIQKRAQEIMGLHSDPRRLEEWLSAASRSSPQLGRYFEALLGFWISELMRAPRFEPGVKVLRGRETLGELDFVFQEPRGAIQHWEVSVKFFLCTARSPEEALRASSYIGTMTKDRLDLKMAKLFEQQLKLVETPEAQARLSGLGFEGLIESRAVVKGALFYPAAENWRTHPHPPEVSSVHARGWWSPQFPKQKEPDTRWAVVDKRRWLSPFQADPEFKSFSRAEIAQFCEPRILEDRRAIMVARLEQEDGGYWVEKERGLLVHPDWPWRVTE